jgi:hypothetical protein
MAAKKSADKRPKTPAQETDATSKAEAPTSEPEVTTQPTAPSTSVPVFEGPAPAQPPVVAPRRGFTVSRPNVPNARRQAPTERHIDHPNNWTRIDVRNPFVGPGRSRFISARKHNTTGVVEYPTDAQNELDRLQALRDEGGE